MTRFKIYLSQKRDTSQNKSDKFRRQPNLNSKAVRGERTISQIEGDTTARIFTEFQ